MTPALREACARAIHVIRADGDTLRAGRAALFILRGVGWRWTARILSVPPLVWFVELGYWVIARNRRFFSRFLFRRQ
jgi:predicted DCC family thiol-disulfide oxidoreductase YuxK